MSFSLKAGEVLAIVGESGCGKSVLCKSILRLLPQTADIKSGKIVGKRHVTLRSLSRARNDSAARFALFHGVPGPDDRA